jgi:ribosome-associated toxin RatA of RatAB toxin-antitoxin module
MPSISRSALVPYSAEQMYQVVNNTQDYPSFVPWCNQSESKILGLNEKQATLHFARGAIKTSFTTRNILTESEVIAMTLIDGPFKQLQGEWRFTEIEELGSRVELSLEFELSNPMLKLALESFFNQICDRLVSSFVERAEQIYK